MRVQEDLRVSAFFNLMEDGAACSGKGTLDLQNNFLSTGIPDQTLYSQTYFRIPPVAPSLPV